MELQQVTAFVDRCIHDAPAPCACACPFGLDVRGFLKKIAKGRLTAARRDYAAATMFPTVAAALCPQHCREKCQRALLGDEPIDMQALERAVLRLTPPQEPAVFTVPPKEQRVAVVGAGPAGLSLALNMAQKKYPVTVFEAGDDLGGSLRGHPDFSIFREDILSQFSREQVTFRFGCTVRSLDELDGFAAVYVATGEGGEGGGDFGLASGWDSALFTTARPGIFLGGALTGMPLMESMAAGAEVSRLMEAYIQTGRVAGGRPAPVCHGHRLVPEDAASAARVLPADPAEGYTKAEAKEEASRCFQCACDRCMTGCEMLEKYRKAPHQMAMEVLADSGAHFLASRTMTRETYACSQCGWCAGACPEGVDLGALLQFSRTARAAEGVQPAAFHDFWLRDLAFVSSDGAYYAPGPGGKGVNYVFFPGCQLPASMPEQTLAAQAWLTETYGAGTVLGCCGASAWWAGEQPLWEANSARLREAWETLGRPVFVLACATCADMLARLTPEIRTVSIYELMADHGGLAVSLPYERAAVFDPCSARRDDGMRRSVRRLAEQAGCALEPMKDEGRCCGWGGHMRTADPALYDQVAENRARMSEQPYIVYCANCREVFREKGKPCRHILEAAFGPCGETYALHERRANRLYVKGRLMMAMEGKTFAPPEQPWDGIVLSVGGETRRQMEEQLISDDDVKECIWTSLQADDRFEDGQGRYLACLPRKVMTYWVEYREQDGAFTVLDAYCHRMRIGGGETA